MADVNGGALYFTSIMDNDKMNAAIEETLRRVQGLSDAVVGSGAAMDKTTQEIVESINIQKRVINDLENTISELNAKINSVEPGAAQDALIKDANTARAELEDEKQGLVALINELNNLQRANAGVAATQEEIRARLTQIGAACEMHETALASLEDEYAKISTQMNTALKSGNDAEYRALRNKAQAIKGEIATRKSLLAELRNQSNALEAEASKLEQSRAAVENTAQSHVSLRTRIRELREEMALYREQFGDQTDKYREMAAELGRLQDIQGDIQTQGKVLSNDQATFQGVISGLNGVVGGFTAAQGAVALFAGENENLQKIMLKVQSLMSITIGLQQVSQTLNKDSAFTLTILNKLKSVWNNLTSAGTSKEVAETSAKVVNTTATTANTVAVQANTAAKTGNAISTTGSAAAQRIQTMAASTGTAANLGLAASFRAVGRAIKSIPVFGWILAAVGVLVELLISLSDAEDKDTEAMEKNKNKRKEWMETMSATNRVQQATGELIDEEYTKVKLLNEIIHDNTQSNKKRKDAINELRNIIPSYNGMLDNEGNLIRDNTKAIDGYIKAMERQAMAKAVMSELEKLSSKEIQAKLQKMRAEAQMNRFRKPEVNNSTLIPGVEAERRDNNSRDYGREQAEMDRKAFYDTAEEQRIDAIAQLAYVRKERKDLLDLVKRENLELETNTTTQAVAAITTDLDAFQTELDAAKSAYQEFFAWINSGDEILQQSANQEFGFLLEQGKTYLDYLKKKRDALLSIENRTEKENDDLRLLNNRIAGETKQTVLDTFTQQLSESINSAGSLVEKLDIIASKRKELSGDGTELDNKKSDILDKEEEKINDDIAKETDALIQEYEEYYNSKLGIASEYEEQINILRFRANQAENQAEKDRINSIADAYEQMLAIQIESFEELDQINAESILRYGSYEQKRMLITSDYEKRIKAARLANQEDVAKKLEGERDMEILKETEAYSQLFGDVEEIALKTAKNARASIFAVLNDLLSKGKITSEQYIDMINKVDKRLNDVTKKQAWAALLGNNKGAGVMNMLFGDGDFETKIDSFKSVFSGAKSDVSAMGGEMGKMSGTMSKVAGGAGGTLAIVDAIIKGVYQTIKAVSDTLVTIADYKESLGKSDSASSLRDTAETLNALNETAMSGWNKLKSGDVMGAMADTIATPFKVLTVLNKQHDARIEKNIEKHQKAIKKLTNAYKQLEWQIERSLGADVYKNQQYAIKNLEEQRKHLYDSIAAEQSKKNSDADRIDDFQEEIYDIERQIEDLYDEISEDLLQTNAKDFANELGDALVEAFGKGEDAAKAMESTVNSVLKNLVLNQLKKDFLEKQLQGALDQLKEDMGYSSGDNFIFDGLSDEEIARFKASVGAATANFNNAMQVYEDLFKDMGLDDTDDSLTGAVKGVSEETANILAGQMNAIRINQLDMSAIMRQQLQQLNQIAVNTAYNKYLSRIERIITILETNQSGNTLRSQGLSL